jgi:hypothetical protein
MRASIMRVPQRGQSGLLIESEYVVLGLYVVTVRPHAHATRPRSSWVRARQMYSGETRSLGGFSLCGIASEIESVRPYAAASDPGSMRRHRQTRDRGK